MESSVVLEACTGSGSGSSSDGEVEQVDDQGIDSDADDEADDQLVVVDGAKVGVVLDPALQYVSFLGNGDTRNRTELMHRTNAPI